MTVHPAASPVTHAGRTWPTKLAYAAVYVAALPLLLAAWAHALDGIVTLPAVGTPVSGIVLAALGILVMAAATVVLRVRGGGWPMSPFPPARQVTTGPYALLENPIYAGAVLAAGGGAIALGSGAGTWIVTPLLAAACLAFVTGYERDATAARFGPRPSPALLRVPAATDAPPAIADRLSLYFIVFLPWLIAYEGVNALGGARGALRLETRLDAAIPVIGWTELLYFLGYPMLLLLPLVVRSQRELRRFVLEGWLATIAMTTVYLVLPTVVDAKPVPDGTPFAPLLLWERAFDDHATGFPAFHVVWCCVAAGVYSRAIPRLRALWWAAAVAISASCVTSGMHVIADIVAGFAAAALVMNAGGIWRVLLHLSERIAASWGERDFGPVRFLSHGMWAGAGAFFGIVIVGALAGGEELLAACAVAFAAIAGAGLWAQFIEGSPALLRPYGFYGGLIGATVAAALLPLIGSDGWLVFGAYAVAAPVVQAFGRVRCLVQGCCHGRPSSEANGIRYTHPRSRVTRLSQLAGRPLHATQLYSIVWSTFTFLLVARLWAAAAPLSFVAGAFFILNGLGRFVEEHFRGEPQTPNVAGLHVYQWLAIGSVVAGALMTTVRTAAAPAMSLPPPQTWLVAIAVAVVTYFAYGVDFPRLNTRFARLV